MKKPKFIYEATWRHNFYFCIGWSEKDFANYALKTFNYESDWSNGDGCCLLCANEGTEISVVWTRNKKIDVIAHECLHAVFNLMEAKKIKLSNETDEVFCYLLQRLIKEVL